MNQCPFKMIFLNLVILKITLADFTLSECNYEIQSLKSRLRRLEQAQEENSEDVNFLIGENSQIRDEMAAVTHFDNVDSIMLSRHDDNEDIFVQFTGRLKVIQNEFAEIYFSYIGNHRAQTYIVAI